MSDLSDFEGRVRALNDELRHRKQVADRLKRERKRRKREILKSKEDALKKQIEVLQFLQEIKDETILFTLKADLCDYFYPYYFTAMYPTSSAIHSD